MVEWHLQGKREVLGENPVSVTLFTIDITRTGMELNQWLREDMPAIIQLPGLLYDVWGLSLYLAVNTYGSRSKN